MTIISTAAVIGQISSKIKITISKQKPEEELDIKFELFSMLIGLVEEWWWFARSCNLDHLNC